MRKLSLQYNWKLELIMGACIVFFSTFLLFSLETSGVANWECKQFIQLHSYTHLCYGKISALVIIAIDTEEVYVRNVIDTFITIQTDFRIPSVTA